jgi:O-antigen/teichoic acid export membrane protein
MSLIKNTSYNLIGFAVPTLIALPCLGILSRWLSMEEFGVFTLTFAILGYASIFDGGLSRAVTREVSIYRGNYNEKIKILGTSNFLILIFGMLASLLLFIFASSVAQLLNISSIYLTTVTLSLKILSFSIPLYLLNLIWIGYLEGMENFFVVNIQKSIGNTLIVLLPVLFCIYEKSLLLAVMGMVFGRLISLIITFFICFKEILGSKFHFDKNVSIRLFKFGGWITVSNIISPLMVNMDKFIISNILGANKVAIYTAPAEGVTRLVNIPIALSKVLFPKIVSSGTLKEQADLERKSYAIVAIFCAPIVFLIFLYAHEIMAIWMGEKYGVMTESILKILIVGFYFNALAQIPYTILQSKGFSKQTAIIHLLEIIPYFISIYFAAVYFGIVGVAVVWVLRVFVDMVLLMVFNYKMRNIKVKFF